MSVFSSKFFWLNLIAIVILVIQYFINNQILVSYVAYEGLAIVVLNAIAGILQTQQVKNLKKQLKK